MMIVGEDGQFVFVNLVGEIDPAQLGHLGRGLHLDSLEQLDLEDDGDA
jgi:hypothetical protein